MRMTEPAADLAVALAVASAKLDAPLPAGLVVLGELGLTGEIRRIAGLERRLTEAARLGFSAAVVPADSGLTKRDRTGPLAGLRIVEVTHLVEALDQLTRPN
jgi:DNA repair protein RadA/Sms